jgi:hypothetical protein
VPLRLPGHRKPREATIIGFDRADGTFYVSIME